MTYPLTWIIILLILAYFRRKKADFKKWIISSVIVFLVFSNSLLFNIVLSAWEGRNTETAETYDGVIILGGYSSWNESHNMVSYNQSSDRLIQGVKVYKKGIADKIVLSGGSGILLKPDEKESAWVSSFLLELGIPKEDIIIENDSRNTHENALFLSKMLDLKGKYLLVTSAFHMRRARACFEKQGINCDHFRVDYFTDKDDYTLETFIVPSAYALAGWQIVIKEWIGYCVYSMRGFI